MSTSVLYRKYRPSNFKSLVGQDEIKNILIRSIQDSKFSQGYLFCGPRGTGKTTTARLVAKSLNCLKFGELGDVCNECENCTLINNAEVTDIVEMDGASNRSIDDIRNLKESLNFLPNILKYKIFIIDEAHMLTKEAFNALLKTLEEPPSHVIFILATTESHKVPATILSRVVRFDFKLADQVTLTEKLDNIAKNESVEIESSILQSIYKFSGGSFRDAESLLAKLISSNQIITQELVNNVLGIIDEDVLVNLIDKIKSGDAVELVKILDELLLIGKEPQRILEQILDILAKNFNDEANISISQDLANLSSQLSRSARSDLLLKIKLANISKNFDLHSAKKSNQGSDVKVKEKFNNVEKIPETNLELDSKFNLDEFLRLIEVRDGRLAAILKDSRIEIRENLANIYNKYKFNLSYIQKKTTLELLKKILEDHLGLKDLTFNIQHDNIPNSGSSENESTIKKSKESVNNDKVEENDLIIKSETNSTNSETTEVNSVNRKDNSDLVENIL